MSDELNAHANRLAECDLRDYQEETADDADMRAGIALAMAYLNNIANQNWIGAERALPYDAEWLKSIGAIEDSTSPFALVFVIPSRHSPGVNLLQCDDADNAADSPWSIKSTFPDGSVESAMIAEEIETRGDVLDLLRILKIKPQSAAVT